MTFGISNIFKTRNPKIVFIFEIDDAFMNVNETIEEQ